MRKLRTRVGIYNIVFTKITRHFSKANEEEKKIEKF